MQRSHELLYADHVIIIMLQIDILNSAASILMKITWIIICWSWIIIMSQINMLSSTASIFVKITWIIITTKILMFLSSAATIYKWMCKLNYYSFIFFRFRSLKWWISWQKHKNLILIIMSIFLQFLSQFSVLDSSKMTKMKWQRSRFLTASIINLIVCSLK